MSEWTTIRIGADVKDELDLLYNALKKKGFKFRNQNEFLKYILADFMKRNNLEKIMIEFSLPKEYENTKI
ncbi:hypothetical protein Metvu_1047 [Methanocaldococcus vulcanius M7]|uniref:Uncharacterized protein n=1 Tax=Methanocaldococcus vulcanius (strain ATCC 700851 / DSM 12094 / M7) TaxID=579137 RepID=C9RH53_METVM|nr:hypothetical protein [Methanocaldococcus vulcanius]ACX72905.1 hypothetical protein Metvu_1047 [Methanocaldococcus vulcanius M7]